ncbi:MAG: S-adenosylmethionine decarboxylase [Bacteroidota bacterium]
MHTYTPGLHILSSFNAAGTALQDAGACKAFFDSIIEESGLSKVGEVYHQFDNGGFTAVICLTESHVSIHTWPEFGLATFDVFLSNFKNDNTEKARVFHHRTLDFFGAAEINTQEVVR